ncbi:MAG: D-alanyl-D-alanine carboxypeptidase [Firmicutes bacterium]|nr:D-alanyl-D-alanine carboxypeptidase [Bacillota bacterium]
MKKLINKTNIFLFAALLTLLIPSLLFSLNSNSFFAANALGGECMVTIESSSGRILYGHNYNSKRPMASVTKILTAITVLENCTDISKPISIPKQAVGVEGSSIYLAEGEKISTLDLLYGLMLQSGNDCAVALAVSTSGNIKDFSDLMNKTAQRAGATSSNFTNPHGLHDDDHYTTALDLALITAYAMNNPIFKQISSTKKQIITRTRTDAVTTIHNKNKILSTLDGADGVKTGFTKKAGRTFVGSATRDNMQIICVVLNCGPMFEDSAALINKAFKEYSLKKIAGGYQSIAAVPIKNSKEKQVSAGTIKDVFYPLKAYETIQVVPKIGTELVAPIKKGYHIGQADFVLNGKTILSESLYTTADTKALNIKDKLGKLIDQWFND